jgi:hypothetical protein
VRSPVPYFPRCVENKDYRAHAMALICIYLYRAIKFGHHTKGLYLICKLQMGKDVVSFLSWAAEPEMEERKLGIFLQTPSTITFCSDCQV